jgi:hypothetical protein
MDELDDLLFLQGVNTDKEHLARSKECRRIVKE